MDWSTPASRWKLYDILQNLACLLVLLIYSLSYCYMNINVIHAYSWGKFVTTCVFVSLTLQVVGGWFAPPPVLKKSMLPFIYTCVILLLVCSDQRFYFKIDLKHYILIYNMLKTPKLTQWTNFQLVARRRLTQRANL